MPRDRYIPPSDDQIRKWEEEKETKEKFHGQRFELIEAALRKLKKDELIELLMRLDTFDPAVRWSIEADVGLKKTPELIAHDLRQAIEIATRVDKSKMNTNFSYSWQAYEETERGFTALVDLAELEIAKEVAIEFMRKASYQVECSDESQMVKEIEACLKPVIQAVADHSHLHRDWAIAMLQADGTGCICSCALEKIVRGKSAVQKDMVCWSEKCSTALRAVFRPSGLTALDGRIVGQQPSENE